MLPTSSAQLYYLLLSLTKPKGLPASLWLFDLGSHLRQTGYYSLRGSLISSFPQPILLIPQPLLLIPHPQLLPSWPTPFFPCSLNLTLTLTLLLPHTTPPSLGLPWLTSKSHWHKQKFQHNPLQPVWLRCAAFRGDRHRLQVRWTFVGKVLSLLLNMLSRLDITVFPRSKRLLISWLQSPSAVILEPQKIKSDTVSPSISHEVRGPDAMIFIFWMLSFKPTFSLSTFTSQC